MVYTKGKQKFSPELLSGLFYCKRKEAIMPLTEVKETLEDIWNFRYV